MKLKLECNIHIVKQILTRNPEAIWEEPRRHPHSR